MEPIYIASTASTIVWVDKIATLDVANGYDFAHETVKHAIVTVCVQSCGKCRAGILKLVQLMIEEKQKRRYCEFCLKLPKIVV